jgi:hypothetical protein
LWVGIAAVILAVGGGGTCLAQTVPLTLPPAMPANLADVPINAPVPPITIDAGDEQISGASSSFTQSGQFTLSGGATVVGGAEFTLRADKITGNMKTGVGTATGNVYFRELNSYLAMDSLFVSRDSQGGSAQDVVMRSYPYTIYAQRLVIEPTEIEMYSAKLTTCPPDQKSEYSIRAGRIVYQPLQHRITIYNGSFYLGRTRIFEFRKLSRRTGTEGAGPAGGDKLLNETFGYNGYNGAFVGYTAHYGPSNKGVTGTLVVAEKHSESVLIVGRTPLIAPRSHLVTTPPKTIFGRVRQAVEETEPVLPIGDPLLFHWFQTVTTMEDRFMSIPNSLTLDGTGVVSYREPVYGHDTDNLFYSRDPEVSLTAVAPISGPRSIPTSHDPGQVRAALRQIALYAVLTPTFGEYYEYPDNVSSSREQGRLDIESRPILVGNNLLFKPTVSYLSSTYPKTHESFQIFQYDLALEKYLTDETGLGAEFIDSQEHGDSPFQFDTPYTSKEMDVRLQSGMAHVIFGAVVKYDLNGKKLFEEQVMIAPKMRSLIPRFTYDFADSTFAFGIDIKGLTY